MTTKQAIRSVLKNTDRFIIGDYNGQKWYCPDAYIATIDNIYANYKPRKSQDMGGFEHISNQPVMNTILERDGQYTLVQSIVPGVEQTLLVTDKMTVTVNTQYLQLMQTLYPTARFEIDTLYKYSPVHVVVKNYTVTNSTGGHLLEVVALIMPLHN
jgi:hypothetical protein